MNKYWFKKYGKNGLIQTTWEGWMVFAIFIGFMTQVNRFVNSIPLIFVVCAVIAAIYFKLAKLKTDPNEIFNKEKDKINFKQILGGLIGLLLFLVIYIGITLARVKILGQ